MFFIVPFFNLHIHRLFFDFPSCSGQHRARSRAPRAPQRVPAGHVVYQAVSGSRRVSDPTGCSPPGLGPREPPGRITGVGSRSASDLTHCVNVLSTSQSIPPWVASFKCCTAFTVIITSGCVPDAVPCIPAAYLIHSSLCRLIPFPRSAAAFFPLATGNR